MRLWTHRGVAAMWLRSVHVFRTAEAQHAVGGLDLDPRDWLADVLRRIADYPEVCTLRNEKAC